MGVCAAITSSLRDDSYGIGFLRPFFCTETETVQPCLRFNYVEFGTIKIRIHQPLPYSKELNGIAVAQPVREEEFTIFRLQHVCQADIVIFILLYDRYLRILYCYLCHIVCDVTRSYLDAPERDSVTDCLVHAVDPYFLVLCVSEGKNTNIFPNGQIICAINALRSE